MNLKQLLAARIEAALEACGAPAPALVKPASRPEFGDYQADGVMAAARAAKANPRALAAEVVQRLELGDAAETVAVAGPGFLNIRISRQFLARRLRLDAPLLEKAAAPQRVVVDYSCPNLAKEMHVGHLRSTIIGDAMARVLEALGHQVIRQNHVGDWGTQFGMLLAHLDEVGGDVRALDDLEAFYRAASQRFREDQAFAAASRAMVVALQGGDARGAHQVAALHRHLLDHCQQIYDRLGTGLKPDHVMAESAYNDRLADTVAALEQRGLLTESEGARCVFLPQFTGKDGRVTPVIVQKSDGAYLYATTDLAAIRHRAEALRADRVLYFTDSRQTLHFQQVFTVAERAGFKPAGLRLEHMPFGAMLGPNGKPFKTRQGGVVKLNALLDQAETHALALVREKNPELSSDEQAEAARCWALARSNTPTWRRTAPMTTSSTGISCWPLRATPHPICCTPTPEFKACSDAGAWIRPPCLINPNRGTQQSGPWRWSWCACRKCWSRQPKAAARIYSAPTCTTWRPSSPNSTRSAPS